VAVPSQSRVAVLLGVGRLGNASDESKFRRDATWLLLQYVVYLKQNLKQIVFGILRWRSCSVKVCRDERCCSIHNMLFCEAIERLEII
jgi:hypothetical protein